MMNIKSKAYKTLAISTHLYNLLIEFFSFCIFFLFVNPHFQSGVFKFSIVFLISIFHQSIGQHAQKRNRLPVI